MSEDKLKTINNELEGIKIFVESQSGPLLVTLRKAYKAPPATARPKEPEPAPKEVSPGSETRM